MLGLLVKGQTRSGFGALGTEEGFLPQKELSLAVANMVEIIGHEYQVEQSSKKKSKPVLNSRSFFFYWCHAEKQKLMDIHQKLIAQDISPAKRIKYWSQICIHVDREMCKDCVSFVKSFAQHQNASICIKDPSSIRVFTAEQVVIEKKNSL
jgi:hypothetical protein